MLEHSVRPAYRSLSSLTAIKRPRFSHARCASTTTSEDARLHALDRPQVYESTSIDPYFNLSYEDWLFRNTPASTPILLFYRNRPCVVIGRNQNPWKEANIALLTEQQIPLVRRRSGGGTVYHDLGNTNFSIMIPRTLFSRSFGADIVAKALQQGMGLSNAGVNDRGDLVVAEGSAYKIVQHRAYHHGTMLISSSLDNLGTYLKSKTPHMETRGIDSVPSPVTTLRSSSSTATHEDFVTAVTRSFAGVFGVKRTTAEKVAQEDVLEGDTKQASYIRTGMDELNTRDWTYGQTPEFSITFSTDFSFGKVTAKVRSRHALVTEVKLDIDSSDADVQSCLRRLEQQLVGTSYAVFDPVDKVDVTDVQASILSWLKSCT